MMPVAGSRPGSLGCMASKKWAANQRRGEMHVERF
jgi:hypothetical protein